jgi:hypothetical protein
MMVKMALTWFSLQERLWFHLHGKVNSQNSGYWRSQNPALINVPLHDSKLICISTKNWTDFFFFKNIVNFERYMEQILHPFFKCLTDEERRYHSVNALIQQECSWTWGMSGDRINSSGLWPAHTSDLNPRDFYLCETIKQKIYRSDPHIIEELTENMRKDHLPTKCQYMNVDFSWTCQEFV